MSIILYAYGRTQREHFSISRQLIKQQTMTTNTVHKIAFDYRLPTLWISVTCRRRRRRHHR